MLELKDLTDKQLNDYKHELIERRVSLKEYYEELNRRNREG